MDWTHELTVFAIIAMNLGTVIALYCNVDRKLEEHRKETNDIIRSIQFEMKDFHGRLEKMDAEFKGKLALQDAEFKAHLMYGHSNKNIEVAN